MTFKFNRKIYLFNSGKGIIDCLFDGNKQVHPIISINKCRWIEDTVNKQKRMKGKRTREQAGSKERKIEESENYISNF